MHRTLKGKVQVSEIIRNGIWISNSEKGRSQGRYFHGAVLKGLMIYGLFSFIFILITYMSSFNTIIM